jgi:hypothetical protein
MALIGIENSRNAVCIQGWNLAAHEGSVEIVHKRIISYTVLMTSIAFGEIKDEMSNAPGDVANRVHRERLISHTKTLSKIGKKLVKCERKISSSME